MTPSVGAVTLLRPRLLRVALLRARALASWARACSRRARAASRSVPPGCWAASWARAALAAANLPGAEVLVEGVESRRLDQLLLDRPVIGGDGVVGGLAKACLECADLPPGRGAEQRFTPATDGYGNDGADSRVQARNVGEGLFDAPIDGGSGKLAAQIAGDGKVVNDIAQR